MTFIGKFLEEKPNKQSHLENTTIKEFTFQGCATLYQDQLQTFKIARLLKCAECFLYVEEFKKKTIMMSIKVVADLIHHSG